MKNEIQAILDMHRQEYVNIYYYNKEITIEINEGGSSGASCWDDKPSIPYDGYDGDKITGEEILKEIIKIFKKDITDEQISELAEECIIKNNTSDRDYYGNCDNRYEVIIDFTKISNEEIAFYLKLKEII